MKKLLCLILAAVLCLGFAACGLGTRTAEDVTDEQAQAEQKAAWGLTLTAQDVTATGLTLVCAQSGGESVGGLQTESWFTLERLEDEKWHSVPYADGIDADRVGWTAEVWLIPQENTVSWSVDWSVLYGELPAGTYRIGKNYTDYRGTGDYDRATLYTEFTVE